MATEQDVFNKLGHIICRRCINKVYHVDLKPWDCLYGLPFPDRCQSCGEMRNIVTGLRLRGKAKLLVPVNTDCKCPVHPSQKAGRNGSVPN